MKYRAAIYEFEGSEVVLTGPEHAHLTDDELIAEAMREARDADLIGGEYPRVSEEEFLERLYVGEWEE